MEKLNIMKYNSKNAIRWLIVFIIIIIVTIWQRDLVVSAIKEIFRIPVYITCACVILMMLYFMTEGMIIKIIANENASGLKWTDGVRCSLFSAFYKTATLGTGSGVAEIYYLGTKGIKTAQSTCITLSQYTVQKITLTLFGCAGYVFILLQGENNVLEYRQWIVTGLAASILVSGGLFGISYSEKLSGRIKKIIAHIFKNNNERKEKLSIRVSEFNNTGKKIWNRKTGILIILNILKFTAWYSIPMVIYLHEYNLQPVHICYMAVINMLAGVMAAPAGVGTFEYVFMRFYGERYGVLAATALILYRFFTMIVPMFIGGIYGGTDKNQYKKGNKKWKEKR